MVVVEAMGWIGDRLRQNLKDPLTNAVSNRTWIVHKFSKSHQKTYPRISVSFIDAPQDIAYVDYGRVADDEKSNYYDINVQLDVDVMTGTQAANNYSSRNFTYESKATDALLKNMLTDNVIELLETLSCGGTDTQAINSNIDVVRLDNINVFDRDEVDEEVQTSRVIFQGVFRKVVRFRMRVESRRT